MSSILLVEDSPTQAMQLKLQLEAGGHDVICCDDGTPALELLANGTFELVVTDLELPILNGLQLIKKMKADYPHVPAILITGQGSERLAAEALKQGATSYVPKSMVDDMLLGTVENVVGIMRADHNYAELIECTVDHRIAFELPNKPALLVTAIDLVTQLAGGMQLLSGIERYRVSQALQHAAANALFRGNLELTREQFPQASVGDVDMDALPAIVRERMNTKPYANRKIHFDARLMRDLIRVVIKDEGPGFDVKAHEARQHEQDGAAAFSGELGRGLTLIHRFMDRVTFNAPGNEVTLIKHCSANPAQHG